MQDIVCVARPLHNVTRKNVPFYWDDDCEAGSLLGVKEVAYLNVNPSCTT